MSDTNLRYIIAQLRRLYLHLLWGGSLKPSDISRMIAGLEELDPSRGDAP
jgi:hypothetical protein